ncbi:MAG TPA: OmpH family outer membrane protein [Bacteroidales bacterium]|nr:OmpH family outer membrane protein [Bacteroidales bacterium]
MKNFIKPLMLLLIVGVISTGAFAQKQKYGYINSDDLLKIMPGADTAVAKYQEYAQSLDTILMTMQQELNTKYEAFSAEQSKMSDLVKQTKTKELQELQDRIKSFQTSAQEDLQKKQNEFLQPIIDKAKSAIEKVAKANGYTMIIDSRQGILLYAAATEDILPLVKKELGIK